MLSCRDMSTLLSTHSPTACGGKVVAPATKGGKTPKWYVKYMTRYFFPSYLSFPLEGNASKRQKGVRGRAPIGCSIAVLTADSGRRPHQLTSLTYSWQSFSSQGQEFSFSSVGGDEVDAFSFGNTACQGCLSAIGMAA